MVVAETCYLFDRGLGPEAEAALLDDVGTDDDHAYRLVSLVDADVRRMTELVRQYADRHRGGTDASIVAVCERLGVETVATLNRRDFDNVRPAHRQALTLLPVAQSIRGSHAAALLRDGPISARVYVRIHSSLCALAAGSGG